MMPKRMLLYLQNMGRSQDHCLITSKRTRQTTFGTNCEAAPLAHYRYVPNRASSIFPVYSHAPHRASNLPSSLSLLIFSAASEWKPDQNESERVPPPTPRRRPKPARPPTPSLPLRTAVNGVDLTPGLALPLPPPVFPHSGQPAKAYGSSRRN